MKHNWTYKKLGEVVKCYRGLTYSKADEVPVSSKMVLRSNNIDLNTHALNFDEIKCVREDLPIADDRKLKKDSIFICMSNGSMQHLGKVAYVDKDYDYAFGGFMGLIVPNPQEVFPKYVYYSLLAPTFLATILREGRGANINNLRFTDLENYSLPMPSKDEQQSIVRELDGINHLIDLQEEQLSEYDRLAQSLFYTTFGDPATNPKGWEVKKLGEVAETTSGGTPSKTHNEYYEGGTIQWLRSGEVSQGLIYKTELFITQAGLDNSSAKIIPVDSVAIAMYGATVGEVGIIKAPMCTNQAVCSIFPNESAIPIYLLYFLRAMKPHYINMAAGGAQPNISQAIIRNTKLPLPPLELQQTFAAQIEAIEQQKALIRRSLDETRTLLAARMQYYF